MFSRVVRKTHLSSRCNLSWLTSWLQQPESQQSRPARQSVATTSVSPSALFTPTGLGPSGSGLRVAVAATGVRDDVNVIVGAGRNMPGYAEVYPGSGFTSGSASEPTGGQLLNPYNGSVLTDGIFVG